MEQSNQATVTIAEPVKMKANAVMAVVQFDGKLRFVFKDAGEFVFDPEKVSAENRARAMMHGFKQRIADGAALQRDDETGASATPEQKMARCKSIADHYMSGATEWELRVAAPKGEGDGSWLAKALVALGKARDVEHANERVLAFATKMHGGQLGPARKALLAAKDVRDKVTELKAAAAPKSDLSADDMLKDI